MPIAEPTEPVTDSIAKVNDEIAVGEDLEFQHKWWRFQRAVWVVFTCLIILDLLGVFGHGYFAKVEAHTPDGVLDVHYERVERYSAPSILRVQFGPGAIHDGKAQLWASEDLVKTLGAQRVVPQPDSSVIGNGGILYTFAASNLPASVEFELEPLSPGTKALALRVPGSQELRLKIFVMP